jgi:hypothetical protein
VWFNRIGWVSFEPTPGRGAPGNEGYTGVRPEQDETVEPDTETDTESPDGTDAPTTTAAPDGTGSGPAPTLPPDIVSGPGGATGIPSITTPEDSLPPDSEPSGGGSAGAWLLLVLILGILGAAVYVWLRVLPDVLRKRRQRLGGEEPADRVLHAWGDTTVLLGVVGAGRRPDETPLEHVERTEAIASTFGIDHDSLERLAYTATRALYARESIDPASATECLQSAAAIGRSLITNTPTKVRMRMWLDPRLSSRIR